MRVGPWGTTTMQVFLGLPPQEAVWVEELQGEGGGWARCEGYAGDAHPPAHQPHQTFLPCFCGLIHHLLSCCSSCSHWNENCGL